jgi:dipeptidyl aminopeptidase/acylaminoacyl peptidase
MNRIFLISAVCFLVQFTVSAEEITYPCSSDKSMQKAMWYPPAVKDKPVPLLVGLHTWSGDYKQASGKAYYKEAKKRGWALIFPDFRGPNWTPDAMCSDKAVQDIVDAVEYAKNHAKIDSKRIYLCGASGGGFMAMMMAGRHPEIWAGVSAWCGISDIRAWHAYNKQKKSRYFKDIEKALGGDPDTSKKAAAEAVKRSPLSYLKNTKKLPLDIWHGTADKVVPASESENAFKVAAAGQAASDADHLATVGRYKIISRKTSGNTRLTITNSGHTIFYPVAVEWLSFQRQGKPAVWKAAAKIKEGTEVER